MIACSTLRNGQVTDKKVRVPLVFTQLQYYCFAYCFYLSWPGVEQGSSTFWAAIHQPDIIHQSAIPYLKEGIQGFHLSPKTAIVVSDFVDKMAKRHLYWFAPRTNDLQYKTLYLHTYERNCWTLTEYNMHLIQEVWNHQTYGQTIEAWQLTDLREERGRRNDDQIGSGRFSTQPIN